MRIHLKQRSIYTVGHGDGDFAALERLLEPHHVTTIIDVRRESQLPDQGEFRRSELEAIAAEAGIGYRWLGDRLGSEPTTTAGATTAGMDEAVGLAGSGAVALLCVEPEPASCHRARVLAPLLEERGYRVVHIRPDGTAQLHQDELGL